MGQFTKLKCRADFAMLAQLVALLTLGVLCSSAPTLRTTTAKPSHLNHCSTGSVIEELLHTVRGNGIVIEVTEYVDTPKDLTKCVYGSLQIFEKSLNSTRTKNQNTVTQLTKLYECKNFFSKDPNEECKTAEVSRNKFIKTLEDFLLHLREQI